MRIILAAVTLAFVVSEAHAVVDGEWAVAELPLTLPVRGRDTEERFTLWRVDPNNPLERFSYPHTP